jgi:hypothetical protein
VPTGTVRSTEKQKRGKTYGDGKKFAIGFDVVVITRGGGQSKAKEGFLFLVRLTEQVADFGCADKARHCVRVRS